jgi:hypothetical protein
MGKSMPVKKKLIYACVIFFLVSHHFLAQSGLPSSKGIVFYEFSSNGELARVLCFQKTFASFSEVLFKGPSGVKIRVTHAQDENFFGQTTEFMHVDTRIAFKSTTSTIFYKQNLPIPTIYTVNGVVIAGIGDGGAREKELFALVQKEFGKLPLEFQQGLREFYQYCANSVPALVVFSAPLGIIFYKQVEPFHTDKMINTNPFDIRAFQDEFKCEL